MAAIRIDDLSTWPEDILELLDPVRDELVADLLHEEDDNRRLANKYVVPYEHIPSPHASTRFLIHQRLDVLARRHSLVGYHCTRLLDEEVEDIQRNGMRSLSVELVQAKIDALMRSGQAPHSFAEKLRDGALVHETHGRRLGMLWAVFHRAMFHERGGVDQLLGKWGGEVIYCGQEEADSSSDTLLRSIGRPRVIELDVPVSELECYGTAERVLQSYLDLHGVERAGRPGFEGHCGVDIPAQAIRAVYSLGEPEFEEITSGYSSWSQTSSGICEVVD